MLGLLDIRPQANEIDLANVPIEFVAGLREKGIEKVGSLDLGVFEEELGSIEWSITSEAFERPAVDGPGLSLQFGVNGEAVWQNGYRLEEDDRIYRESARYTLGEVRVHDSILGLDQQAQARILLHEAFGALGYNDHHSALSGSLITIDRHPETLPALGKAFFNRKTLKLGGSSVGGGGDSVALELKARVLSSIMRQPVTTEFLANFTAIAFEPMDEPENQRVMVMYKVNLRKSFPHRPEFFGVRQDRSYEELVTV